jgi:hypothetical protein
LAQQILTLQGLMTMPVITNILICGCIYLLEHCNALQSLLFLLHINDLPKATAGKATSILFAYDTNILITSPNISQFQNDSKISFDQISKWFNVNQFSLNLEKTHFIHYINKNIDNSDIKIIFEDKQTSKVTTTTFLGLYTDNTFSWNTHINYVAAKLSSACYVMRSIKPYVSFHILKIIHYSNFHLVMTHGPLFWGHSSDSIWIFRLQKRIVRMMMGCGRDDSCRKLFPFLEILPLLFSSSFVIKNMKNFTVSSEIY